VAETFRRRREDDIAVSDRRGDRFRRLLAVLVSRRISQENCLVGDFRCDGVQRLRDGFASVIGDDGTRFVRPEVHALFDSRPRRRIE